MLPGKQCGHVMPLVTVEFLYFAERQTGVVSRLRAGYVKNPVTRQDRISAYRPTLQPRVCLRKLTNFDKLIYRNVVKHLPLSARGPPDFETINTARLSQTDVLFQRRSPERSARTHVPVVELGGPSSLGVNARVVP